MKLLFFVNLVLAVIQYLQTGNLSTYRVRGKEEQFLSVAGLLSILCIPLVVSGGVAMAAVLDTAGSTLTPWYVHGTWIVSLLAIILLVVRVLIFAAGLISGVHHGVGSWHQHYRGLHERLETVEYDLSNIRRNNGAG